MDIDECFIGGCERLCRSILLTFYTDAGEFTFLLMKTRRANFLFLKFLFSNFNMTITLNNFSMT